MFHIENESLRAAVLDPVADRERLCSRYVAGGYVWQVTDKQKGDLLSGPAFPNEPPPFDGQGLPDAFEIALGQDRARVGEDVYVIGAGRVKRESSVRPFHVRDNRLVAGFAPWKVEQGTAQITMTSDEAFREFALQLIRKVSLQGRSLISVTSVANRCAVDLPLRWFAHPFFPHAGLEACAFSREAAFPSYLPPTGGYEFNESGWLQRKAGYDWKKGCYQLLLLPFGYPVDVTQRHPILGEVRIECGFPLAWMPVWANDKTFSFEPYLHTVLPAGAKTQWEMRYHF